MRLVRDDDASRLPEIPRPNAGTCRTNPDAHHLEHLVRELLCGNVVLRIALERPAPGDIPGSMSPHATPGGRTDEPSPHVAGRIDAAGHDLSATVDAWLTHLAARGKSPRTTASFRQVVMSAARERGWTFEEDLTATAVVAYMDAQRAAGLWSGTTYNRNLSCFRSLERFVARLRNPSMTLRDADRADHDGEEGARPATDEEALAMMRRAWVFQEAGRCDGNRPLERLLLFAAACRGGEPEQLRWRHVRLDVPVPFIHWTREIQKNKREQYVALAPELVAMLLEHREQMRKLAAVTPVIRKRVKGGKVRERPVSPDDPEAFVLPTLSGKGTWEADRKALGIAAEDVMGLPFSRHSARKWFSTRLTAAGVPEKMVDFLMRHRGRPEHRYYIPTLEEQRAELSRVPRLMPPSSGAWGSGQPVDKSSRASDALTKQGKSADSEHATPGPRSTDSTRPPAPPARYPESRLVVPCRAAGPVESSSEPGEPAPVREGESRFSSPRMPRVGLEPTTSGL